MELDRFLNLLAATVGAMGSLYVLKGLAGLSPSVMARLSQTFIDFSSTQVRSIAAQKADSIVGIGLVLSAFGIAVLNFAWAPGALEFFESRLAGIAAVGAGAILLWMTSALVARRLHRHYENLIGVIITRRLVEEIISMKTLSPVYFRSLRDYAEILLQLRRAEGESPRQFFVRVVERVGLTIPEGFSIAKDHENTA
jgi:uncharacterized protein YjeT (DUF2065 family)